MPLFEINYLMIFRIITSRRLTFKWAQVRGGGVNMHKSQSQEQFFSICIQKNIHHKMYTVNFTLNTTHFNCTYR